MNRKEYRTAKFGSWERSLALDAQVAAAGRAEGIPFAFDKIERTPNTLDAHRLIWLADKEGVQDAVVEAVFRAYFTEGRDISRTAVLLDVVAEAGLDRGRAEAVLNSDEGLAAIRAAEEQARRAGVQGVPYFLINGTRGPVRCEGTECLPRRLRAGGGYVRRRGERLQDRAGRGAVMLNGNGTAPKVVVVGGSLGGLFNAIALRSLGCEVEVFEKSSGLMKDRGAGIVFQQEVAEFLTRYEVAPLESVVVPVRTRRYLDADGSVLQEGPMPQAMTSWDLLYRKLRAAFGDDHYHVGVRLVGFETANDKVTARFDGGREEVCDLLIGCGRPRLDGAATTPAERAVGVRRVRRMAGRGAGTPSPGPRRRVRRPLHLLPSPAHAHPLLPDPRPGRVVARRGSGGSIGSGT